MLTSIKNDKALNKDIPFLDNKKDLSPVFARHETFHPRHGWLKKGVEKSTAFLDENASNILGVGKNMVNAIKYWCHAYKLLEDNNEEKNIVTSFAQTLFTLDSYLEDLSSLWLLHWNLMQDKCIATTWYFVFNEYRKIDFTIDELLSGLKDFKEKEFPNNKIVDSSLLKDLHCLIRMYVEQKINKNSIEESIDCPFVELNLIKTTDYKHFSFNIGEKPGLVPEIIVACCLEYSNLYNKSSKTIALSRLLYEKNSPGLVFKLSENALYDSIEKIAKEFKEIHLSDTAGLLQLSFEGEALQLSKQIIKYYYDGRK